MGKPDDIPQDIWDAASNAVGAAGVYTSGTLSHLLLLERVARAIIAERERCANLAGHAADAIVDVEMFAAMKLLELQSAIRGDQS